MSDTNNDINAEEGQHHSLTFNKNIINIGTLNNRGLNSLSKQLSTFSLFEIDYKLDIIGLTETKIKKSEEKIWSKAKKHVKITKKQKNISLSHNNLVDSTGSSHTSMTAAPSREFNNVYTTWWSGKEDNYYGAGVGLAIKKPLASRVYAVQRLNGRALMADLHLKGGINIRIIVIYSPANAEDKQERAILNGKIKDWIDKGLHSRKKLIVMGDLNVNTINGLAPVTHAYNLPNLSAKKSIIDILINAGLKDIQQASNAAPRPTWTITRNNVKIQTRIDYIWLSLDLFQEIKGFDIIENEQFLTDHCLITAHIAGHNLLFDSARASEKRSSFKRSVFDIENMTTGDWENYRSYITSRVVNSSSFQRLFDIEINYRRSCWIDSVWKEILGIFTDAKNKAGKIKFVTRRDKNNNLNRIYNEKYKDLRWCISWRKRLQPISSPRHIPHNDRTEVANICSKYDIKGDNLFEQKDFETSIMEWKKVYNKKINFITKQIRLSIDAEDTMASLDQMREAIDLRCQEFADNKHAMLNKLLHRDNRSVIIDHLVTKDENGLDVLITDEKEIKDTVKNHFANITNFQLTTSPQLVQEWEPFYEPRMDINSHIYHGLLSPVSDDEWLEILGDLNKNKAAGISEISYDLIIKSGDDMHKVLKVLINEIFRQQYIPKKWLDAQIFPIPKPEDWGGDISKTRPITLLECPRKIMFKILNNRLANIFVNNHHILGNNNFAALPGKSVIEPIHTLNCILEDAREHNKELWMLFQDMSKAYDRVNRNFLFKAMARLRIPEDFISLIKNSLQNRKNRIITALGNTDDYTMVNGIDQGEVISPLLWVIYYNPLFERINAQIKNAYEMGYDFNWTSNRYQQREYVNSIAYMDDSTFISATKDGLTRTLIIADSFNLMTGILVNTKKSELIVINSNENQKSINYGNDQFTIKAKPELEPIRFLGVWISGKKNDKFIKQQIKEEIDVVSNRLSRKRITSQQIVYVINAVIMPRIEFRTHLTVFDEDTCTKLQTPIRRLLRHKSGLANTVPNCILWEKQFYGLVDMFNRCLESQTANLIANLNDQGQLGKLMLIRTAQLQLSEWLPVNPLENWPYFNCNNFKYSLIAQILCLLNHWEFNIQWSRGNLFDFEGTIPLTKVFKDYNYRKYKDAFKSKKLLFLDQVVEGEFLLQWDQLYTKIKFNQQGRIPRWWKIIEEVTISLKLRYLNNEFRMDAVNSFTSNFERLLMYSKIDKRKNNWIIFKRHHQNISRNVIIGLMVNDSWNPLADTFKMVHYRFRSQDSTNISAFKCNKTTCDVGSRSSNGDCLITVNRLSALKLNCRYQKMENDCFGIKISYYTLLYELDRMVPTDSEYKVNVNIELSDREDRKILLSWIFNTSTEIIDRLLAIYDSSNSAALTDWVVYTDGSLQRYQIDIAGTMRNDMGFGWVIVKDESPFEKFYASSYEWPSSTRMELLAVITAISILPQNSKLTIYTDSANVITKYQFLLNEKSFRRKRKLPNFNLWDILFTIIKKLNISLFFEKVKAHSGDIFNDQADSLAKLGVSAPKLMINSAALDTKATLGWFEFAVDINP